MAKSTTTRTAPVTTANHKRKGRNIAATSEAPALPPAELAAPEGQPADPAPAAQLEHAAAEAAAAEANKRKIEKDRPEQNGVKRPSAGGLCRAVWDFCDSIHSAEAVPTVAQVKLEAEARGWNSNNASIEYYQWRKFNGIRGRVKTTAQVADVAPEPEA